MSNCFLRRLVVSPGRMLPQFDKTQMIYTVILSSLELKTTLDVLPEIHSDIVKITFNTDEQSNQVFITEGSTKIIDITVFSESKEHSRTYTLHISRMSAKVAFIESISIHPGQLIPNFHRHIHQYSCYLGANISYIKLHFILPDTRCSLQINKEDPKPLYDLNMGITIFKAKVYSIDESQSKKYEIEVHRKQMPRYIHISDPIKRLKYEDPISLSPFYCPQKILDYDIWKMMSQPLLNQITYLKRMQCGKKVFEYVPFQMELSMEYDQKVSDLKGMIPLTYGGFSDELKLSYLGNLLFKCSEVSPFKHIRMNKISAFTYTEDLIPKWQTNLERNKVDEESEMEDDIEETLLEYFFYLPTFPLESDYVFNDEVNPVERLNELISMASRSIRVSPENSDLHLLLALLLEEKFMIEDTLNIRSDLFRKTSSENNEYSSANQTMINKICEKAGFTKPPTLIQQLKTLQDENNYLYNRSMMREADVIQMLLEWKSKEASPDGKMSFYVCDESNILGQAAVKYSTSLKLDINSAVKHFHVARMMMIEGKYGEAIIRLENALSILPEHAPSKFLLGLAQSNLSKLSDFKLDRTIEYLLDGMEKFITLISNHSMLEEAEVRKFSKKLKGDDQNFFRVGNPFICRGILALARLLLKKGSNNFYIKPLHAFHSALHIACMGWSNLAQGCIMAQFELVIIECHDELYNILNDETLDLPTDVILKRCEYLNAFISSTILPTTQRLIDIQESTCRVMVFHQPCNEFYLINLGMVIMKKAEMYPFKHPKYVENIKNAIHIFRIALEMNGKPMLGPPEPFLQSLSWFKVHRLNYLTKKAPLVICESFRLVENDQPGTLSNINSVTTESTKKLSKKNSFNYSKNTPDKYSYDQRSRRSSSLYSAEKRIFKCSDKQIKKFSLNTLNLMKPLTMKQLSSRRISLFQTCHKEKVTNFVDKSTKKEHPLIHISINPPTYYSRLMLGRAFRSNHQFIEAIKCFNFIRKVTQLNSLKATVNREILEILLETHNLDQALEFMNKIHITEIKISPEDLLLCHEIIKVLIKKRLFNDERLEKHCFILAKYDGLHSIKDILEKNNMEKLYKKISTKLK